MKQLFIYALFALICLALPQASLAAGDSGKEGEGSQILPYEYVEMDPVILPIIGHDGATQTVSLVVTLEIDGVNNAEKASALKPRLNDAFLTKLYGNLSHVSMRGGAAYVNVVAMKEDLTKAAEKVLGDESGLHELLIQVLQQQKI